MSESKISKNIKNYEFDTKLSIMDSNTNASIEVFMSTQNAKDLVVKLLDKIFKGDKHCYFNLYGKLEEDKE